MTATLHLVTRMLGPGQLHEQLDHCFRRNLLGSRSYRSLSDRFW